MNLRAGSLLLAGLILIASGFFSRNAEAAILFGPEWTFTNRDLRDAGKAAGDLIVATPANARARDKLARHLLSNCATCKLTFEQNRYLQHEPIYTLSLDDSHSVKIDIDPWVVEVNSAPQTSADFYKHRAFYEKVFEAARSAGLKAHKRISGGHVHIDFASAFGTNELLARNFIVDLMNRPELAMGAFGEDYLNAAPLALLSHEQVSSFENVLARYDNGELTFDQWIEAINTSVYFRTYADSQPKPTSKFQAVNLMRTRAGLAMRTIELRFFRPQRSFSEFLLIMNLIEARIESLKGLTTPLEFIPKTLSAKALSPKARARAVRDYAQAAGHTPAAYRSLVVDDISEKLSPRVCIDAFGGL